MSLEKLQEIRERRLEKQQKVVQQNKSLLETAEQQLELCKQNLVSFQQWRLNHQEGMFKGLQGQACTPQGMFEYRAKLDKLVQEEEQIRLTIADAQQKLETAHKNLVQAKEAAATLALKNEKTKEIVKIQDKAARELQRSLD